MSTTKICVTPGLPVYKGKKKTGHVPSPSAAYKSDQHVAIFVIYRAHIVGLNTWAR